jgi:hypothetical protein
LKALQAQINPHFLYNTLDTIVWMAQAKKTDQVIDIVQALSNFFRIALSKGQDWITIEPGDRAYSLLPDHSEAALSRYSGLFDRSG